MSDGSGPSSRGSYASYDPDTRLWKTSQGSLFGGWEMFSGTWPQQGMMRNGAVFPLRPWVPLISGSASFSSPISEGHQAEFPTPSSTKYGTSGNGTGNNTISRGRPSLDTMARKGMWPTPTGSDYKGADLARDENRSGKRHSGDLLVTAVARLEMWPTPTAGDAKSSGSRNLEGSKAHAGVSLTDAVRTGDSSTPRGESIGQLNPTWVEWLMGFPSGWTDLEHSATPSCPK
mgnify:CR=1 FL=1